MSRTPAPPDDYDEADISWEEPPDFIDDPDFPKEEPVELTVPYAGTLADFLKNARKVWKNYHALKPKKSRGRPSVEGQIYVVLEKAEQSAQLGKKPSQGKLIGFVKDELGDKAPSDDAVRKYVKGWRLLWRKPNNALTLQDLRWLEKKLPLRFKGLCERAEHELDMICITPMLDNPLMEKQKFLEDHSKFIVVIGQMFPRAAPTPQNSAPRNPHEG